MFINSVLGIILFTFSLPLVAVNVGDPVRATDITNLRNNINSRRLCFGIGNWAWTDSALNPGDQIRTVHITDLRAALNNIYTQCGSGACAFVGLGSVTAANRSWTNPSLEGQAIRASHINELITTVNDVTCTATTYDWSTGPVGTCNGGSGTWVPSAWSTCVGGTTTWNIGGWSACSVSSGTGKQTRSVTCVHVSNSGTQTRTLTCQFNANSGTGTRTVTCLRSDGLEVADSYCTGPKPSTTANCTPTNPSVCGTPPSKTQACTQTGVASCSSAPATSQACTVNKPCGTRPHGSVWSTREGCFCPREETYRTLRCDNGVTKQIKCCGGCPGMGGR